MEKRKFKFKEERLMKKSQVDEDCIFLMSLLSSIKKLDDIQRVELSIEFLSSVDRRIHIFKNLSPTASNTSCTPTPSPRAASLDSTNRRDSDTSKHSSRISCV